MTWETSIIHVWWPGIETLPSYCRVEEKQPLLSFVISSFLSFTSTLGCFIGFILHCSDLVSYNVQRSSIIVSSKMTQLLVPNPAPQVFYFGSVDFISYKQGPDGRSCCSKREWLVQEFSVASFSSSCHAKLLSTNYTERPGVTETRFIWIFFSEASSKRLWDRMEQAVAWSLLVTVGFYVRCLIRFRHIFMLIHTRATFKNVTDIKNDLHLLCFIADTDASASPACPSKLKLKAKAFVLNCSDLLHLASELFCLGWSDRKNCLQSNGKGCVIVHRSVEKQLSDLWYVQPVNMDERRI